MQRWCDQDRNRHRFFRYFLGRSFRNLPLWSWPPIGERKFGFQRWPNDRWYSHGWGRRAYKVVFYFINSVDTLRVKMLWFFNIFLGITVDKAHSTENTSSSQLQKLLNNLFVCYLFASTNFNKVGNSIYLNIGLLFYSEEKLWFSINDFITYRDIRLLTSLDMGGQTSPPPFSK